MSDKKNLYVGVIYKAAWLGLKKIVPIAAVDRDGKIQFEVPDNPEARELIRLYDLHPRIALCEFVDQIKGLNSQVRSLRGNLNNKSNDRPRDQKVCEHE